MKKIGWILSAQKGIDEILFKPEAQSDLCSGCGLAVKKDNPNKGVAIPNRYRRLDALHTADLQHIFSERVANVVRLMATETPTILEVSSSGFYWFEPRTKILFDSVRRGTRCLVPCKVCGQCFETIGATPAYLQSRELEEYSISRTDLSFGTGSSQAPLLIVDHKLKREIASLDPKGLYFEEAFGAE